MQILFRDLFESSCDHLLITHVGIYVFLVQLEVVVATFYHLKKKIDKGL